MNPMTPTLEELQQLIVAFAGAHEKGFTAACGACSAERKLRQLAVTFSKPPDPAPVATVHTIRHFARGSGVLEVNCACGATWTHPAGTSDAEIDSVFASHVKYFTRAKMVTL